MPSDEAGSRHACHIGAKCRKYGMALIDPVHVTQTLERLHARIEARFPQSGLAAVCRDTIAAAGVIGPSAAKLEKPYWLLRLAVFVLLAGGLAAQVAAARFVHLEDTRLSAPDLVQGLEAAVNLALLFGGAVWFLLNLEERAKRRKALQGLHSLRSLAHVIDMHQLTKDPTIILQPPAPTQASPQRTMTRFELTRYLDYCAEMLALIGKLAALYADSSRDAVVINAVNDIEDLTGNLGRKIWQKITILSALEESGRS